MAEFETLGDERNKRQRRRLELIQEYVKNNPNLDRDAAQQFKQLLVDEGLLQDPSIMEDSSVEQVDSEEA